MLQVEPDHWVRVDTQEVLYLEEDHSGQTHWVTLRGRFPDLERPRLTEALAKACRAGVFVQVSPHYAVAPSRILGIRLQRRGAHRLEVEGPAGSVELPLEPHRLHQLEVCLDALDLGGGFLLSEPEEDWVLIGFGVSAWRPGAAGSGSFTESQNLVFEFAEPALGSPPVELSLDRLALQAVDAFIAVNQGPKDFDFLTDVVAGISLFMKLEMLEVSAISIVENSLGVFLNVQQPEASARFKNPPGLAPNRFPVKKTVLSQGLMLAGFNLLPYGFCHDSTALLDQGFDFASGLKWEQVVHGEDSVSLSLFPA
jgi:hypothetical protein